MKVQASGKIGGKTLYVVYYNDKRYFYKEGDDVIGVPVEINRNFSYKEHMRFMKAKNIIEKVKTIIASQYGK